MKIRPHAVHKCNQALFEAVHKIRETKHLIKFTTKKKSFNTSFKLPSFSNEILAAQLEQIIAFNKVVCLEIIIIFFVFEEWQIKPVPGFRFHLVDRVLDASMLVQSVVVAYKIIQLQI
jgi:hypothetical protein